MAYIYRRGKYFWVGYVIGGTPVQKSLKVTSKEAAKTLLAEYQILEAKHVNKSHALMIKRGIKGAFEEFIEQRSTRERTKEWYEYCKAYFLTFCEGAGVNNLADLSIAVIEGFYNKRKAEAPDGARSNMRALRAFLNYSIKKGYIHDNPAKAVRVDKPIKKVFRDLSFDEAKRLLAAAKKNGPAFYPLFATAYYTGLRAGELVYLEAGDVKHKEGYVHVKHKEENPIKDHQERKIPLNGKLKTILKNLKPTGRWLFGTKNGAPRINNLNREIKRLGKIAKIDTKGLKLQVLRETFGSHLRRRGVDIALISQYMGHSSIDVTLRHYAHIRLEQTHREIDLL